MRALILAGAVALAAAPALAQSTVYNGGSANYRPNASLGTSQDVRSSVSSLEQQFKRIDISHNGMITRGEWGAAGLYSPDFDKLDFDHDGRLTLDEWSGRRISVTTASTDKTPSK